MESRSGPQPNPQISHVFVVMLENHSFDQMFAMSGIPGITAATPANFNTYLGKTYPVTSGAPLSMCTDPGHEFADVVEQLAGERATYPSHGPYPHIDNSGFVANYANSISEHTGRPSTLDYGDVMACFETPRQLPVLYQLATEFAICDHWYSSLPGPTWPNRFFVHGASSSYLEDSPTREEIPWWEIDGFRYANGSIYDSLKKNHLRYRFYNDTTGWPHELSLYSDVPQLGSKFGAIPQVSSLRGVSLFRDFHSLKHFASDLHGNYPYAYTFIEPHYGALLENTYRGGSSQHPMDDVYGGEHLLAAVYEAIRNSPLWNSSLLIITYDEHGGLYDSVAPGPAPAPGDPRLHPFNKKYHFQFNQYGVRVPAVVVSPLIPKGTVDHTVYDHSSVPATLEKQFGLAPLTRRDAAANDVLHLLSLATPRTDSPTALDRPARVLREEAAAAVSLEERARVDAQPLPESGNLIGALGILKKTEHEMAAEAADAAPDSREVVAAAVDERFALIQTRGEARAYAAEVMGAVGRIRAVREAAERVEPPAS